MFLDIFIWNYNVVEENALTNRYSAYDFSDEEKAGG